MLILKSWSKQLHPKTEMLSSWPHIIFFLPWNMLLNTMSEWKFRIWNFTKVHKSFIKIFLIIFFYDNIKHLFSFWVNYSRSQFLPKNTTKFQHWYIKIASLGAGYTIKHKHKHINSKNTNLWKQWCYGHAYYIFSL